ncbi:uncharacterized protein J3R85_009888 [Psidium guajava]|nr:uncharacterized protein J3R85_009888 [Psidium guajava]
MAASDRRLPLSDQQRSGRSVPLSPSGEIVHTGQSLLCLCIYRHTYTHTHAANVHCIRRNQKHLLDLREKSPPQHIRCRKGKVMMRR